jgi:hypothetical protein
VIVVHDDDVNGAERKREGIDESGPETTETVLHVALSNVVCTK